MAISINHQDGFCYWRISREQPVIFGDHLVQLTLAARSGIFLLECLAVIQYVLEFAQGVNRAQFASDTRVISQGLLKLGRIGVIGRKLRLALTIVLDTGRCSRNAVGGEKCRNFWLMS